MTENEHIQKNIDTLKDDLNRMSLVSVDPSDAKVTRILTGIVETLDKMNKLIDTQ